MIFQLFIEGKSPLIFHEFPGITMIFLIFRHYSCQPRINVNHTLLIRGYSSKSHNLRNFYGTPQLSSHSGFINPGLTLDTIFPIQLLGIRGCPEQLPAFHPWFRTARRSCGLSEWSSRCFSSLPRQQAQIDGTVGGGRETWRPLLTVVVLKGKKHGKTS